MTQPVPAPVVKTIELAPPGYPMVVRVIADSPLRASSDQLVIWVVSKANPLENSLVVVRMFVEELGVTVYSASQDGKGLGVRYLIPMRLVRLVEEAMPLDILAEELALAEEGGEDEDPPESERPAPVAGAQTAP